MIDARRRERELLRRSALILLVRSTLLEIEAIEEEHGLRPARFEDRGRVRKGRGCNGTAGCGNLAAEPDM